VCKVFGPDAVFLQQACHLTSGAYYKLERRAALLQYLLVRPLSPFPSSPSHLQLTPRARAPQVGFLPGAQAHKNLMQPRQEHVDLRAACFCHRRIVDIGYVCSVCLSSASTFSLSGCAARVAARLVHWWDRRTDPDALAARAHTQSSAAHFQYALPAGTSYLMRARARRAHAACRSSPLTPPSSSLPPSLPRPPSPSRLPLPTTSPPTRSTKFPMSTLKRLGFGAAPGAGGGLARPKKRKVPPGGGAGAPGGARASPAPGGVGAAGGGAASARASPVPAAGAAAGGGGGQAG